MVKEIYLSSWDLKFRCSINDKGFTIPLGVAIFYAELWENGDYHQVFRVTKKAHNGNTFYVIDLRYGYYIHLTKRDRLITDNLKILTPLMSLVLN